MKLFSRQLILTSIFVLTLEGVSAAPVDLSTWISDDMGAATWTVQTPSTDSVLQSRNGNPTVFFEPGARAQEGASISGTLSVETKSDDDYIGLVLGYDQGELGSNNTDFILIDWKQKSQTISSCAGEAKAGIAVSRVTDASVACSFWNHETGAVNELKRANNLGSVGWEDFTLYAFEINFDTDLIELMVNGTLEISLTAQEAGVSAFDEGAFGFFSYSQKNVLYGNIQTLRSQPQASIANKIPSVTEPNSFGLWLLSVLCLITCSRRNRRNEFVSK